MSFRIPEPAIARHPGLMLAPRELRSWSDSLPLGNPPRAGQMLLEQARLLVRDPDPGHRLPSLLAIYDEPTARLLDIVAERLEKNREHAVPLDRLEDTLVQLLTELAYGQLRIANALPAIGRQPSAALLYAAIDRLDSAHVIERLHYRPRDPARWGLMASIYLHASDRGVDAESVDRPTRRDGEPADIRGLFFRALVIGLCDPYRHRPGDILAWHRWVGRHTGRLELARLPQGALSIPVDTGGDVDPLAAARRGKPGPDMRYLATENFLRELRDDASAPAGLYDALSDLIRGRKSQDQRRSPRQPRDHPFRLLPGLRQVHARLHELTSGTPAESGVGPSLACRQTNQSKHGAAFRLQGPVQPPLGIGEALLAEADNPTPGAVPVGFVGRIKRVVALEAGEIEIGVEKLAGRLIPVRLSGGAAERARGATYGLLQQSSTGGRFTLLAVRSVYRERDTVVAESINAHFTLRMQGLASTTRWLAYIDVEPVD